METQTEEKKPEIDFTTGSTLLDLVVGGGLRMGFKAGKIINIVGDKSAGKSFLAAEMITANYNKYKKKFRWAYDDAESGFTFDTKSLYGIDIINNEAPKSETIEQLYGNLRLFLEGMGKNEVGIYVIDSLDGLSSDQIIDLSNERFKAFQKDKEFNKGSYKMEDKKFLSQEFFRGLGHILQDKNVLLVIISQVRHNIDAFSFKKYTRSGGKALDHWSDCILWLANKAKIKTKNRTTEILVNAKTEKSKTPRPYRSCDLSIIFDYGVDNIGSNLDYLFDLRGDSGKVLKSSKINWNDELKDISREDIILKLESDKKMRQELEQRVIDKWEKIETEIQSNRAPKYQ